MNRDTIVLGRNESHGVPAARLWLANVVWAVHMAIVLVLTLGWLIPWRTPLWGVAALSLVVQFGWWAGNDRCILTVLEEKLRGGTQRVSLPEDAERPANFIVGILSSLCGRPVSHRVANAMSYAVTWLGLAVIVLRLTLT